MFNSKNDPLVDSVKKIIQENDVRHRVETELNEHLGIASRKALPHELQAEYDSVLEEAIKEALVGNQHKIDANKNGKVDAHDFKLLRANKQQMEEEQIDEAGSKSFGAAVAKAEAARQRALKGAESKVKKGISPEVAAREHDVSVADLKKHMMKEEAEQTNEDYSGLRRHKFKGKTTYMTGPGTYDDKEETPLTHSQARKMNRTMKSAPDKVKAKLWKKFWGTGQMEEEAEQLDEVGDSKKGREVLRQYAQKALRRGDMARRMSNNGQNADMEKYANKRQDGVKRAIDRLAKEEKEYSVDTERDIADDEREYGVDKEREIAKKKYPKKAKTMEEASYSAKEARKGKDIGKPGKMFSKIAQSAGERYGSEERGKAVAGAILKKLRAKNMQEQTTRPLEEKTLTKAEMAKREELAKKMKKGDWAKRYGERGKSVMYATATKMAKKLAEADGMKYVAPGLYLDKERQNNLEYGKNRTWGTGEQPVVTSTQSTPQVAQNMANNGAPAAAVDAARKASVGPFPGRPDAPLSPNKPNLQQRQADIAKMAPQTAAPQPKAPKAPVTGLRLPTPTRSVSDTEVMNSPEYKTAVKSVGGEKAARRIQIGQDVEGLGKFAKGDTITSKVRSLLSKRT